MGLATSGRAFIAQQYDAAQSVDSLAESVLEQITGPRGQMDPNEMVAASVAASMAAADTVTESVTVTTSIGKTKRRRYLQLWQQSQQQTLVALQWQLR